MVAAFRAHLASTRRRELESVSHVPLEHSTENQGDPVSLALTTHTVDLEPATALLVPLANTLHTKVQDAHLALPGNLKMVLKILVRFAQLTPSVAKEQQAVLLVL